MGHCIGKRKRQNAVIEHLESGTGMNGDDVYSVNSFLRRVYELGLFCILSL